MLKADDLIPDTTDYLRDLGSRRNPRHKESKTVNEDNDNNFVMDIDDTGGSLKKLFQHYRELIKMIQLSTLFFLFFLQIQTKIYRV